MFLLGGAIRMIFTLDSLANIVNAPAGVALTSLTISNFELCYELIQNEEMYRFLLNRTQPIMIKSLSAQIQMQTVQSGTGGQISLAYNLGTLDSVKGVLFMATAQSPSATVAFNGQFDAVDLSCGNSLTTAGDYQLIIAGVPYPSKVISTLQNRACVLSELKKFTTCFGNQKFVSIFDKENEYDISSSEFNYAQNGQTTLDIPSKFYVGVHLERLHNSQIWSGISTQSTPIIVKVNTGTATTSTYNCIMCAICDVLLIIDPVQQSAVVKF
jgi:hypothetical protein